VGGKGGEAGVILAKLDEQCRGHWFGLFLPKLNDAVQLNETSCLPRMNPFQYDTEHRKGRKETKKRGQEHKILRKQTERMQTSERDEI